MNHFFAITLPPETAQQLAHFVDEWKQSLPPDLRVRWQEPEDYHLTLNFLGNLSSTLQPRLIHAAAHVPEKFEPFTIHLSFTGAFDSAKRPAVLWAGLHEKRQTSQLSKSIDHALAEQRFVIPSHSYVPHITLGRCRARRDEDDIPSMKVGTPIAIEMPVPGFALMQTLPPQEHQNEAKSRYTIVHTFPFGTSHSCTP